MHARAAQVESVSKDDITCVARNSAQLDGLLTVFHTERSMDSLHNVQNDLPILNDYDKKAIASLVSEFEARTAHACPLEPARPPGRHACSSSV